MWQSQAFRALSVFLTEHLAEFKLSLSEWKLLGHLSEVSDMTPSEISKLLNVKLPVSTRLLKSLEAKKYVSRQVNNKDSRVIHACITQAGKELVNKVETKLRREMKLFLEDIDRADLEVYVKVLLQLSKKI